VTRDATADATTPGRPAPLPPAGPTLREAVRSAAAELATAGVPSPEPDANALACHLLGCDRGQLWRHLDGPAPRGYSQLVRRRAQRVPLQHLTGVAYFRHLTLQVGPGVFVPRPETEVLVDLALDRIDATGRPGDEVVVVDLCSGSGAIAAAIAQERPSSQVHAVEVDPAALSWLRRNLAGTSVTVHEADVTRVDDVLPDRHGVADVVTANPPYIPTGSVPRDPEVTDHDPPLALYSGPDGLDHIRSVERVAARLLRPGGWVVVEHADAQGDSAPAVFADPRCWQHVRDHLDLAGRPRVTTAQRCGG
jgi:release factor glutamine methyltransferase